jgi:hypothetical protein
MSHPPPHQPLPKFAQLICRAKRHNFQGVLLAIDPGETTGITLIERKGEEVFLEHQAQLVTWPFPLGSDALRDQFDCPELDAVVYEAYHIYAWRLHEHEFSEVPTIQLIGVLKHLAHQACIPAYVQTAQVGKGFFTDDKLKAFDMYFPGMPHARDSLRHAAQWLMFGPKNK